MNSLLNHKEAKTRHKVECVLFLFLSMQHFKLRQKPVDINKSGDTHFYFWPNKSKNVLSPKLTHLSKLGWPRPNGGSNNCFKPPTINGCRH